LKQIKLLNARPLNDSTQQFKTHQKDAGLIKPGVKLSHSLCKVSFSCLCMGTGVRKTFQSTWQCSVDIFVSKVSYLRVCPSLCV